MGKSHYFVLGLALVSAGQVASIDCGSVIQILSLQPPPTDVHLHSAEPLHRGCEYGRHISKLN